MREIVHEPRPGRARSVRLCPVSELDPVMIRTTGLGRRFGSVWVRDVSFEVRRGEVLGLLGPNGAGKTTTVRIV